MDKNLPFIHGQKFPFILPLPFLPPPPLPLPCIMNIILVYDHVFFKLVDCRHWVIVLDSIRLISSILQDLLSWDGLSLCVMSDCSPSQAPTTLGGSAVPPPYNNLGLLVVTNSWPNLQNEIKDLDCTGLFLR